MRLEEWIGNRGYIDEICAWKVPYSLIKMICGLKAIICLWSFIDTKIKKFKRYDVLQRDLIKEIKIKYPRVKEKFERNFSKYIKELRKNAQIEINEMADGKRKIKNTLDWDSEDSMNILLNKFR